MRKAISPEEAAALVPAGAALMIGGFMAVGTPERVIDELVRQRKGGFTVIANDTARPGVGIGKLISAGCCAKVIVSHIGTNPETQRQMIEGRLQVELAPQGTLA
jgi:acetate CoA/acetoacetate CoA-transferase alpha subunit